VILPPLVFPVLPNVMDWSMKYVCTFSLAPSMINNNPINRLFHYDPTFSEVVVLLKSDLDVQQTKPQISLS
jgi:hypothetical protein